MKDSPLRNTLGVLVIILSIVYGFSTGSFWKAILAFIVLNLILGPLIRLLEKFGIVKSSEDYYLQGSSSASSSKKVLTIGDFKDFWLKNPKLSLDNALDEFYSLITRRGSSGKAQSYDNPEELKRKARLKLQILRANRIEDMYTDEAALSYMFYEEHLEDIAEGRTMQDRMTMISKGELKDSFSGQVHQSFKELRDQESEDP